MGPPKKLLNYPADSMKNAIADVRRGMSVAAAARKNGVPRITLLYKIKGKTPEERKMGPSSILTSEEESLLVRWIQKMAKCGFPVTRNQVVSVQQLLVALDRENPFPNNRPGRTWFELFLKRNPTLSFRTPENLTTSRAAVTPENLKLWYSEIQNHLQENNLMSIMDDPRRVFNADESAFFLNPKGIRVLATKGDKAVNQIVNPDEKECLTVLMAANAAGSLAPPSIVFKYQRIPIDIAFSVPSSWGIGRSDSGWMNGALFYEYIANVFHPWLENNNIPRPVILFIDGHSSHLTMHTSDFCDSHGILLIALYPNSTHLIQPLDVSLFASLKLRWKKKVQSWRINNISNPILKKKDFAPLLKEVIDEISPSVIENGFRTCGLLPWNPEAVISKLMSCDQEKRDSKGAELNKPDTQLNELKVTLRVIEGIIGKEKAEMFKNSPTWPLDEDKSLYDLFRKLTDDIKLLEFRHEIETAPLIIDDNLALGTDTIIDSSCLEKEPLAEKELYPENSTQQNCFPSPFKKVLPWPEPPKKISKRKSYPGFVISQTWRDFHENQLNKKKEEEENRKRKATDKLKKKEEKEKLKKERQTKSLTRKKKGKKVKKVESSSSEEEWVPSNESDEASENEEPPEVESLFSPFYSQQEDNKGESNIEESHSDEVEQQIAMSDDRSLTEIDIEIGNFLIITKKSKFGKQNFKKLCQVSGIEDNKILAYVLKPMNRLKNVFRKSENKPRPLDPKCLEIKQKVSDVPLIFGSGLQEWYQFPFSIDIDT